MKLYVLLDIDMTVQIKDQRLSFWRHTFVLLSVCDNKYNSEAVENIEQENAKDADNDKTEEEMSESGETTSSTTESDVSDVEMDSNNEDPFAWDKQVWRWCLFVNQSFRPRLSVISPPVIGHFAPGYLAPYFRVIYAVQNVIFLIL